MSLTSTKIFTKSRKDSGPSSTLNTTNIINRINQSEQADSLTETHTIWGNDFNGTQDVEGDLVIKNDHSLTVQGDARFESFQRADSYMNFDSADSIDQPSDFTTKNVNFTLNDTNCKINDTNSKTCIEIDSSKGIKIDGSASITTPNLSVDVINSNNSSNITFEDPVIMRGGLDLSDSSLKVDTLYSNDITNSGEIKTQDLTVYGNAHFFNLIIEEVQHAGGSLILSPANFKVDAVEDGQDYTAGTDCPQYFVSSSMNDVYHSVKLYQICYDEDSNLLSENEWQPGDHAFCHTFNLQGTNKHYWTPVIAVQHDVEAVVGGRPRRCNMIEIIDSITSSGELQTTLPEGTAEAGDQIACLGSKNQLRQSAIMICSSTSYDEQVSAPCIIQYANINSFTLWNKQWSYWSKSGNLFRGNFRAENGFDLEDYIANQGTYYVHTAWANSADGTVSFTKDRSQIENPQYQGYASTSSLDDSSLTPNDYTWSKCYNSAENNEEAERRLIPITERFYVNADNACWIELAYSQSNLLATDTITARVQTLSGASTDYQVNLQSTIISGETILTLRQKLQDDWHLLPATRQYYAARIMLQDASGNLLDQRVINITWTAGALFEIAESIRTRVTDNEGNISTLTQTAESITTRVQQLEVDFSGVSDSADSIYSRMSEIEQNAASIAASVQQNTGSINSVSGQLTQTREQLADLQLTVDGIDLSAADRAIGSVNILDNTDFGNQPSHDAWTTWQSSIQEQKQGFTSLTGSVSFTPQGSESGDLINVMEQPLTGKLSPNTWYTLSFYALHNSQFSTYIYPNTGDTGEIQYVDRQASGYTTGDCHIHWTTSAQGWEKHVFTFRTSPSITAGQTIRFLVRVHKQDGSFTSISGLSQIKLEEGQVATAWSLSEYDHESRLTLTAERISLNVRDGLENTGIDITTGQIRLRSDNTTIEGTLNIDSQGGGIIVLDDDGTPRVNIRKEAIGEINTISSTGYADFRRSLSINDYEQNYTAAVSRSFIINLGHVDSGDLIQFSTPEYDNAILLNVKTHGYDSTGSPMTLHTALSLSMSIEVKAGTSTQYTRTISKSLHPNNTFDYDRDVPFYIDDSFRTNASGDATATITISQTGQQHQAALSSMDDASIDVFNRAVMLSLGLSFGIRRTVKQITRIGTDGFYAAGSTVDRFLYFGPSGFEAVWRANSAGTSGIRLYNNQVQFLYASDASGLESGRVWGSADGAFQLPSQGKFSFSNARQSSGLANLSGTYKFYDCLAEDSLIVASGTSNDLSGVQGAAIILPMKYGSASGRLHNVPAGKRYWLKNMSATNIIVTTSTPGNNIVKFNSRTANASTVTLGPYPIMFMFSGEYWLQMTET